MSLHELQRKVHVAKDKVNSFGGYNYRTAEGILSAIKAEMPEGAHVVVSDTMQELAGQIFVTATATVTFADGASHEAQGHAMHPLSKKGMDPSQITGSASSYARKYALAGLMALDDGSVDPDAAKEPYKEAERDPTEVSTNMIADVDRAQNPGALTSLMSEREFKNNAAWLKVEHPTHADMVRIAVEKKRLEFKHAED